MRILFLAPRLPWPLSEGTRQRSFAILRALAERHEVTLSAPAEPDEAQAAFAALEPMLAGFIPVPAAFNQRQPLPAQPGRVKRMGSYAWDFLRTRTPYAFRPTSAAYRALATERRPAFDAVFCRYLSMFPIASAFSPRSIVVDADDLNYLGLARQATSGGQGLRSILLGLESARSYLYEQRRFRRLAQVLVCSEGDLARVHCRRKTILRNGVDLPDAAKVESRPRPKTLVFVGALSYDPNLDGLRWFLQHVWPRLRTLDPEVRLMVVGRGGDHKSLAFAQAPGVQIVGEVESTAPWISSAVLSIVPLQYGLGTRIKIIESLGCARMVVSTRIGAEGLEAIDEAAGLVRVDHPGLMAARIHSLLDDPARALALGAQGRALVESQYTWRSLTRTLADDFENWVPPRVRASTAAAVAVQTRSLDPVDGAHDAHHANPWGSTQTASL